MTKREAYDRFYNDAFDYVTKWWPDCHGKQLDNRIAGVIDEMQAQAERVEADPSTLTRVDVYDVDMHVSTMCYIKFTGYDYIAQYNRPRDFAKDAHYGSREELEATIRKTLAFAVVKHYIGHYCFIYLR